MKAEAIVITLLFFWICMPARQLAAQAAEEPLLQVASMQCDGERHALSVNSSRPRLSWQNRNRSASSQSAFQITLRESQAKTESAPLWDSGLQKSAASSYQYDGPPLRPRTTYVWTLRVFDQKGASSRAASSRFTMAPPKGEPIRGKWIGRPGPFKPLETVPEGFSSKMVADQARPHDLRIDLGRLVSIDELRLHPLRLFRAAVDIPGFGFPTRFLVATSPTIDTRNATVVYDCTSSDYSGQPGEPLVIPMNGRVAQYVAIRTTIRAEQFGVCFVGFAELEVISGGKNVAGGARVLSKESLDSNSMQRPFLVDGRLPSGGPDRRADGPALFLGKEIQVVGRVRSAVMRLCGLGLARVYVNGRKKHTRGRISRYDKRIYYQAVDLTDELQKGSNFLRVILGSGRWGSRVPDEFKSEQSSWKNTPRLLAEIEFIDDAGHHVVVTDEGWFQEEGYILDQGVKNGETHDGARRRRWDAAKPPFRATPARVVDPPEAPLAYQSTPEVVAQESHQGSITLFDDGRRALVDFGLNLSGTVRVVFQGKAGSRVRMDLREALMPDGTLDLVPSALRTLGRFQSHELILSGEDDIFAPELSTAGFRYMQVQLPAGATLKSATAISQRADLAEVSAFSCRHPELTAILQLARRTLEACAQDTPIDCPQRERLGWLLDGYVTATSFMTIWDCDAWLAAWLQDMRDAQDKTGYIPSVAPGSDLFNFDRLPHVTHMADPWWGGSYGFLAWQHYLYYGDEKVLEQALPGMERWFDFLMLFAPEGILDWGIGDWNETPSPTEKTPVAFTSSAALHKTAVHCARVARALGDDRKAARYAEKAATLAAQILKHFPLDKEGRLHASRQTPQVLALQQGIVTPADRDRVWSALKTQLGRGTDFRLNTGYVGTGPLLDLLLDEGEGDLALDAILNRSEGSWMHFVASGFSTMPEAWRGGQDSRNHLPLALIAAAIKKLCGFPQPLADGPGFRRFEIRPQAMKRIGAASWSYDSPQGTISCRWQCTDTLRLTLQVPESSECFIRLDEVDLSQVRINNKPVAEGTLILRNGASVLRLVGGRYTITGPLRS